MHVWLEPNGLKSKPAQEQAGSKVAQQAGAEVIELMERARIELLALCDELEHIADALPDPSTRQASMHFARSLGPALVRLHRMEEDVLFPALTKQVGDGAEHAATIEHLKLDHYEDECFAEEVQEALLAFGSGNGGLSLEALGYMLRGFFTSKRRHIAFEGEVLKPLVQVAARRRRGPEAG